MPAKPLVAHASAARARAGLINDPDLIAATAADLTEAKTLSAIQRANLTTKQRERVGVAMLTDTVEEWLQRNLAAAPNLTPATRATIVRLLTVQDGEGK